jgi:hypothetical protein
MMSFLHKCYSICIGVNFLAQGLVQELHNFLFDLRSGSYIYICVCVCVLVCDFFVN